MKYQIKIDSWIKVLFFFLVLYFAGITVVLITEGLWFVSFITLPLALFMVTILTKSDMEFQEEHLLLQISFFKSRIKYDSVIKVEKKRKIVTSGFALSRDIIRIHTNSKFIKFIDISPETRDEVLGELQRRCKNIKE